IKLRNEARSAMRMAQDLWQKRQGEKFIPYHKNQKVWLEATNLKTTHPTSKLAPRRYGPFTVTKVISPVVYQLQIPEQWKIHNVFHASLLTPYQETVIHGPNYAEPPPELVNGEPEWEVQSIIGHRKYGRHKQLQYRV